MYPWVFRICLDIEASNNTRSRRCEKTRENYFRLNAKKLQKVLDGVKKTFIVRSQSREIAMQQCPTSEHQQRIRPKGIERRLASDYLSIGSKYPPNEYRQPPKETRLCWKSNRIVQTVCYQPMLGTFRKDTVGKDWILESFWDVKRYSLITKGSQS